MIKQLKHNNILLLSVKNSENVPYRNFRTLRICLIFQYGFKAILEKSIKTGHTNIRTLLMTLLDDERFRVMA